MGQVHALRLIELNTWNFWSGHFIDILTEERIFPKTAVTSTIRCGGLYQLILTTKPFTNEQFPARTISGCWAEDARPEFL